MIGSVRIILIFSNGNNLSMVYQSHEVSNLRYKLICRIFVTSSFDVLSISWTSLGWKCESQKILDRILSLSFCDSSFILVYQVSFLCSSAYSARDDLYLSPASLETQRSLRVVHLEPLFIFFAADTHGLTQTIIDRLDRWLPSMPCGQL